MIRNIDLNVDSLCEMPTFFQKNNLGLRKEWICNERPITMCPIVTC